MSPPAGKCQCSTTSEESRSGCAGLVNAADVQTEPSPPSDAASAEVDIARKRLDERARLWNERPLLRQIYGAYHERIDGARSQAEGIDLEIGSGHGSFASFRPETIVCDIIPFPWLDCAADAHHLPFKNGSVANLIMLDVLHHLADPERFFSEVSRVLVRGGRAIMVEPYVSALSYLAWRFVHDEDIDMSVFPLQEQVGKDDSPSADPWSANTAIPSLVFWKHLSEFHSMFPGLSVIQRERFDCLVYPLSGGYNQRRLVPLPLVRPLQIAEKLLSSLAGMMAFRCFIVIEKRKK